uniref:Uncharacterized protein n=1 Tax=Caenorhabditis japonica TaxID=281687 RepID=A0A8R1EHZ0_CAEJA
MPLPGFNKTVPQSDIFTTPKYRSELKTDGNDHEVRPAAHGPSDECKPGCSSARCRPKTRILPNFYRKLDGRLLTLRTLADDVNHATSEGMLVTSLKLTSIFVT